MKKFLAILAIAAISLTAARASLSTITLNSSRPSAVLAGPARAVALQTASTNASGTVSLERITSCSQSWYEDVVTNIVLYTDVETNVYHVVTNDHVTVWRTRYRGAGVVESNVYAVAVNDTPEYPADWPGMVVTTNEVADTVLQTNWTYQVVAGTNTVTNAVLRSAYRAATNTVYSGSFSGGGLNTVTNLTWSLLFPGDVLRESGSVTNNGGSITLMLEN
jgi:hypothetical protein